MRSIGRFILAGTLAMGAFAGTAAARGHGEAKKGQEMTLGELPPAVRSTFNEEARGGKIEELHKKKEDGKTIYEGEVIKGGKGSDLEVSESGKVLKRGAPHEEATEHEEQEK